MPYNTLGSLGDDPGPGNAPISGLGDSLADRFGSWQQLRPDNAGVGWSPDRGPLGWNMTPPPPFATQAPPPQPAPYVGPQENRFVPGVPGYPGVPLPQPRPAEAPQTAVAAGPSSSFLQRFFANFELPPAAKPRAQTPFAFGPPGQRFAQVGGAQRGVGPLLQRPTGTGTGYG